MLANGFCTVFTGGGGFAQGLNRRKEKRGCGGLDGGEKPVILPDCLEAHAGSRDECGRRGVGGSPLAGKRVKLSQVWETRTSVEVDYGYQLENLSST